MRSVFLILLGVAIFAALVAHNTRAGAKKRGGVSTPRSHRRKAGKSLQQFLPLQGFHPSGPMIVSGRFRQMIRVGDQNLYAMSLEEITVLRDRFRDMVKHLDHPFQISVQARRANYTDFVRYSEDVVKKTAKGYTNGDFSSYADALVHYLREEAAKPRTDRENLLVVGVMPKMTGESEAEQLQRLLREQGFVETGLQKMGLTYDVLDPIASVETIQNFYNRERAMSQRYRDAYQRLTHAPHVDGEEVTGDDVARTTKA